LSIVEVLRAKQRRFEPNIKTSRNQQ